MKKAFFTLIFILLLSHSLFSYDLEYFKQLDAEQQVQLWLEEYQYQRYGWRRLNYAEAIEIFKDVIIKAPKTVAIISININPFNFFIYI